MSTLYMVHVSMSERAQCNMLVKSPTRTFRPHWSDIVSWQLQDFPLARFPLFRHYFH